ncbi:MAG TPA: response regulator [Longimicrobium sp.]|nr:response regulator [Longimicrobium sp.]
MLVCGNTEWLARSFESILAPYGCTVARASDHDQAWARFDELHPDVVLLEAEHGMDGVEPLCRTLRAHPRLGSSTPVLVVSAGALSRVDRLAAMRAGAWDAFGFPLDPEELVLKVRALAAVRREVVEAEERGLLDAPSGLYNARGLARRAQEMVAEAYRNQRPLACITFHAEPDGPEGAERDGRADALAELLRLAGRTSDVIGRLHRGEFAVLAPATGWEGAERLARRVCGTVQRELERSGAAEVRVYSGRFAIDGAGQPRVQAADLLANAAEDLHAALSALGGNGNGKGKKNGQGNGSAHADAPAPPPAQAATLPAPPAAA